MSIQEIEIAITKLPTKRIIELSTWLEEYQASRWDQQIKDDLDSGRLDSILAEVDAEYEAGLAQPLCNTSHYRVIGSIIKPCLKKHSD